MVLLIDCDIVTYRIGYTTNNDEEWIALARTDTLIEDICLEMKSEEYRCFLTSTDKSNFRYKIYPEYKANRKAEKPVHYEAIREHLVKAHGAEIIYGMEADDALGIEQNEETCICSIDKDLYQIEGWHYNFVTKEKFFITKEEALCNFYKQCLIGDKGTDNIPGCPGIGKRIADKLLVPEMSEKEMLEVVLKTYEQQYKKKGLPNWKEDFLRNARLIKLKRKWGEELWEIPNFGSCETDKGSESTTGTQEENIQSTER